MGRRKGAVNKVESLPRGVTKYTDGREKPFCVTHRKLPREFYESAEQAKSRKKELVDLEKNEGSAALTYTRKDHVEVVEARKILPPGVSLIDAARFYSQHHPGELFLVRDAVARFVSTKQKLSRRPTGKPTPHVSDLRKRLNSFALSFGDHPITSLTGEMILDWLNSLNQAPRSVQNYRVALNNLFNFSVRRKWLARSPLDTIAKEDLPAVRAPKKHPLQQWEVDALFNYARENTPRYLTYWALRFYIGVRAAEAERFRWEWIQRDLKRIVIPGWFYGHDDPDQIEQGTKTGDDWAIHDAPPIFWEIYDAAETFKKGQIPAPYPEVWRSKIRPAWLKATGHKQWPNNAPRDTFCTMHISAYMDPQRTALILKHTNSQTLHRSYLGTLVSEAEGKAYLGDTSGNDK